MGGLNEGLIFSYIIYLHDRNATYAILNLLGVRRLSSSSGKARFFRGDTRRAVYRSDMIVNGLEEQCGVEDALIQPKRSRRGV